MKTMANASQLFDVPGSPGRDRSNRPLSIVAAGLRSAGGSASVLVLRDAAGRVVGNWQRDAGNATVDQAVLLAVIEGLRQARERRADKVTVFCPSPILAARLDRKAPMAWDDPAARLWMRARALSHGFEQCNFRLLDAASVRELNGTAAACGNSDLAVAA